MDIHEYQAKELLSRYAVEIPRGGLAYSPEQAAYRASEIGGAKWVVKAQIHSGARGKAGGIRICSSDTEISDAADHMLGRKLVTHQTGPRGKLVSRLYVEEAMDIMREIYIGFVLDRKEERVMIVASGSGGMEIEEIAENEPDSIIRATVDPGTGMLEFQAREIAFGLGLDNSMIGKATQTLMGCYRAFRDLDASMLEINPLVVTRDGRLVALDAKMSFDDNALFRRAHISEMRDKSQEDPRETFASDRGLSYVGLDGRIGCIINGAGLAMATMDMIKIAGGEPANFLDIGGGASPERVAKSFRARSRRQAGRGDPRQHLRRHQPLRLGGRRRGQGDPRSRRAGAADRPPGGYQCRRRPRILAESGENIIVAETLAEAAEKAVAAWRSVTTEVAA